MSYIDTETGMHRGGPEPRAGISAGEAVARSSPDSTPQWRRDSPTLPAASDRVPKGEGFPVTKILAINLGALRDFVGLSVAQMINLVSFGYKQYKDKKFVLKARPDLGLADIFGAVEDWESFESFNDFFKPWTFIRRPAVAAHWRDDAEFGRQRLVGINPSHIRRCTKELLADFLRGAAPGNITLADGRPLEVARQAGQLYFLDYRILSGVVGSQMQDELGRYPLGPTCILHQNAAGTLLPVAIRLEHSQGEGASPGDRIFTPASRPDDWLTARIGVTSADAAYQGVVTHLLFTHLVMDPFAVSTYRNLPSDHLVYHLLKPHFFNTFAINDLSRVLFLGRGRYFDSTGALAYSGSLELLTRAYSGTGSNGYSGEPWKFYKRALPDDLNARDVGDLTDYHYRDDALLHWTAIETYVRQVLRIAYPTAGALSRDEDLQRWKDELVSPSMGGINSLLPPEKADQLKNKLTNVDDLVSIVTNVIFTATAQHAAVNFGQRDYYTWIPNAQFAIYQPFSDILSAGATPQYKPLARLPNRAQTIRQVVLSRALSIEPPLTSASLLTMKCPYQVESAKHAFELFRGRLMEIEEEISARNRVRERSYTYLLSSKVPQSIAI